MPPVQITDYVHEAYSALPLALSIVENNVNSNGGRAMIHEKLGPIFREYHVDEKFGLGLLHRHFDMTSDERLVAVGDVATPWDMNEFSTTGPGGALHPVAWLFHEDKLAPYEYAFIGIGPGNAAAYPNLQDYPAFLEALATQFKEIGLNDHLALIMHPGPDFKGSVEFTMGRANITVPDSMVSDTHTVESMFLFNPGMIATGVTKKCKHKKCE